TGSRDSAQALLAWSQSQVAEDVDELRLQTAFFNSHPLGVFIETLERLARKRRTVNILIGSNAPGTQRDHVRDLVRLLGLPRKNCRLGVVQYGNAFFHPKTYHFRRRDGSQAAYVGSANLTDRG